MTRAEVPWAFARGDPFRAIGALELLASLVCVMVFKPSFTTMRGARISVTAATDNLGNGFLVDRLMTTKFPLYIVLMEVAAQLEANRVALSLAWRPRDENEEADALTNEVFTAFDPRMRVEVSWSSLEFLVLPRIVQSALAYFEAMAQERRAARRPAGGAKRSRAQAPLREREPW